MTTIGDDEVLTISEIIRTLAMSHVPDWEQQRLNLLSARDYLEDGANHCARVWLDKKLSHDDYHTLIGSFRAAWTVINRIISEEFDDIPVERQVQLKVSTLGQPD